MDVFECEGQHIPVPDSTTRVRRLDRTKWHRPLVSIVVTHFNYSHYLEDALLSILDQTHENWECVVVDDASDQDHRNAAQQIIKNIGLNKIKLLSLQSNIGQTGSFFSGLAETSGEFACLLDPDDRYMPTFLEELLKAHLNSTVFCPILCCEQLLLKDGSLLSGVTGWNKMRFMEHRTGVAEVPQTEIERLLYFPPTAEGWLWTSTSSMMFRRAALNLARPHKPLAYKVSTDAYLAQGLHRLGGTLFLTKSLVYRGLHDTNSWLASGIFATTQHQGRPLRKSHSAECLVDVLEAIGHNGGAEHLERNMPTAPQLKPENQNLTKIARWRRSIRKSWRRFLGQPN